VGSLEVLRQIMLLCGSPGFTRGMLGGGVAELQPAEVGWFTSRATVPGAVRLISPAGFAAE